MVASGRALDLILHERQRPARRLRGDRASPWPSVESFVVTTVRNVGTRIAEIGDHMGTGLLQVAPALSQNDPSASKSGSIVHPVLDARTPIDRLLSKYPPDDYDLIGHMLERGLGHQAPRAVPSSPWDGFVLHADHHGLIRLRADMCAQD